MGSINNLPQGATLIEQFSGIVDKPAAWTHGKRVSMQHYSDYCSKGYKSKYEHVLTHFLVLRIGGQKTRCSMYSGKRASQAAEIFAKWKKDLEPYFKAREAA